mgnify:FL=1
MSKNMGSSFNPVTPEAFKSGFRQVPTVVTVVTFDAAEGPCGLTIGSFVSLSLDPPLVCFNVQQASVIHDHIVEAERFLVHVLRDDQADLSDQFADSSKVSRDQLDPTKTEVRSDNIPTLKNYLVRFDCKKREVLNGGDHSIILGCVEQVDEGDPARPIVFHQRAYHAIGSHVAYQSHPK